MKADTGPWTGTNHVDGKPFTLLPSLFYLFVIITVAVNKSLSKS